MNIVDSAKHSLLSLGTAPVIWLMLALSVASLAVALERAWFFHRTRADITTIVRVLSERLRAHDAAGARAVLLASRSSEAAVASVGLAELRRGANAVREAMAAAALLEHARLERRLGFLGTLAANAPFIGLFGTVVGIVLAFDELGASHARASASAAVMASIAEALVTTAIGIAIAVPAVAAFNAFQARIKLISDQTAALGHVLLGFAESDPARGERHGYNGSLLDDAALALARHSSSHEEA
jgi:biopolymer transport protein ExbB